jgi:Transglycosylase SLT domain/SPOR domain
LRINRGDFTLAVVIVAFAISRGLAGPLSDAAGQPIEPQAEQAKDPGSADPQSPVSHPLSEQTDGLSSGIESSAPTRPSAETLCAALGWAALQNDLPAQFFTRLIWQESRFDISSVSRAGAQGIAQFMPATARWRGVANPFEPIQALHQAARWLKELRAQFGNLGLAAAAYNSGPRRVQDWLAGRGRLPGETRVYVRTVTGRSAEDWATSRATDHADVDAGAIPCSEVAKLFSHKQARLPAPALAKASATPAGALSAPWGLQLIGDSSEARALSEYRALQQRFPKILGDRPPLILKTSARGPASWYRIRVAETTRERANALCAQLASAGGKCLVQRN